MANYSVLNVSEELLCSLLGRHDIVIDNKKYIFGLGPHSWHGAPPKTLGISYVMTPMKVSLVMVMR